MQPLKVRTCSTSPIEADAIALLRSIERYQPPAGQKQRVRVRLFERSTPRRVLVPWPAFVICLLLIAAGASAALTGRWIRRAQHLLPTNGVHPNPAEQPKGALALTGEGKLAVTVPGKSLSDSDSVQQSSVTRGATAPIALSPSNHLDSPTHLEAPTRTTQPSEKVLVFDAMRALRREGHPERAAKLLDEYLRRYPEGSLAEEALALSIETSTALGDPESTKSSRSISGTLSDREVPSRC